MRESDEMKMFRVVVNGSEYKVGIEELTDEKPIRPISARPSPPVKTVQARPEPTPTPAPAPTAESGGTDTAIVAPIPGTVLRIAVGIGDPVTKGQTLLVLEAMKMENEIMAPSDGVVQLLHVSPGASVKTGETLVVLSR
jgi:biotin carboxyl carrier protein